MNMTTRMCLGMMFGAAFAGIMKWNIAIGISIGMLFGIALGDSTSEHKEKLGRKFS